jgi:hypothetical protein
MCSAYLRDTMTAGPDVVRGSGPNHSPGFVAPMTQQRVFPMDGSTVSHHAIITLAIFWLGDIVQLPECSFPSR